MCKSPQHWKKSRPRGKSRYWKNWGRRGGDRRKISNSVELRPERLAKSTLRGVNNGKIFVELTKKITGTEGKVKKGRLRGILRGEQRENRGIKTDQVTRRNWYKGEDTGG